MVKALLLALSLASGSALALGQSYPDLPVALKNGTGAMLGQTIYIGLGTAGTQWFALDLSKPEKKWVSIAPFPDAARDQAVTAAIDGKLYVIGGIGKATPMSTTAIFNQVYRYDPATDAWNLLPTRAPREVAGGIGTVQGDSVLLLGGVNRNIFDGYFKDLAAADGDTVRQAAITRAYFDQRPQDYFWESDVMSYSPKDNRWNFVDRLPFAPTSGSALAAQSGSFTVINGEIKPGLRTPTVHQGQRSASGVSWTSLPDLSEATAGEAQEGLAGAYAGFSHGTLLVAGGANFPGARAKFASGVNYAHEGLTKTWRQEVYALTGGQWKVVGMLPQAQGYGLAVQHGDEVILVGGEVQGGQATARVIALELRGDAILSRR